MSGEVSRGMELFEHCLGETVQCRRWMIHWNRAKPILASVICFLGCQPQMRVSPRALVDASTQIVVVITPNWTSTTGTIQRFERATPTSDWRSLESAVPVVVGRTGTAWGAGFDG